MTASVDAWERRLAREGLAPLDRPGSEHENTIRKYASGPGAERRTAPTMKYVTIARREGVEISPPDVAGSQAAVEAWLSWARSVYDTHAFGGKRQRSVWRLYSDGETLTEIQGKLHVSRRAVTRAIERVERSAPPAPCENPWRKSGRTDPARRMDDTQVIALLRSLVAKQLEGDMAAITNKTNTVHYDRILLLPGRTVDTRHARMHAKDRVAFTDIDGRPHAGGIDLELETKSPAGDLPTITTVTVPWGMIRQAERTRPEEQDAAPAPSGKRTEKARAAQ